MVPHSVPAPDGLPARGAPHETVAAFWHQLAHHPDSPWLVPALTASEAVLPEWEHGPAHAPIAKWALMVLRHPDGEDRLRALVAAGDLPVDTADPPHGADLAEAALVAGKPALLDWLLTHGAPLPPNAPLFLAIRDTDPHVISELLEALHRAGASFEGKDGFAALERALTHRDLPHDGIVHIVRVLLEKGARASLPDPAQSSVGFAGNTVLVMGAIRFPELLPALVTSAPLHPQEGQQALESAARYAQVSSMACLMDAGVLPGRSDKGRTLLTDLIQGHFDRVRAHSEQEWTSDPRASEVLRSVDLLLGAGLRADADGLPDTFGLYPTTLAARARWPALMERLLPTSRAVWNENSRSEPPLYTVLSAAPPVLMEAWLDQALEQGAEVDAAARDWETALHRAMKEGHIPLTLALIARGANPHKTGSIVTPWKLAAPEVRQAVKTWQLAQELGASLPDAPNAEPALETGAHRRAPRL